MLAKIMFPGYFEPHQLHEPKKSKFFLNNKDHWLLFRKKRFAASGDGEYAALHELDLSGYHFPDFPLDHLAFINCKLDGVSFQYNDFFMTAFMNCSLRDVDFTKTANFRIIAFGCDFTGARFPEEGWPSYDLDKRIVPALFYGCTLSKEQEEYLKANHHIVARTSTDIEMANISEDYMFAACEIASAPVIDA